MKEDSEFMFTKYYLAQNYLRNKDYENCQTIMKNLKSLAKNKWKTLFLSLLQSLEEVLLYSPDLKAEKIDCYLDFIIIGDELSSVKQTRVDSIISTMSSLENGLEIRKSLNSQDLFTIFFLIEKSSVHYYHNFDFQIKIQTKHEELVALMENLVIEFNEKSYNLKIPFSTMTREMNVWKANVSLNFGKGVTGNRLSVENVEIQKEETFLFCFIEIIKIYRAKNGKSCKISLIYLKENLKFIKNESIFLKPAVHAIEAVVNHPENVFLNEEVDLDITIKKH